MDDSRKRGWVKEFTGYRIDVTETGIDQWLSQFDAGDRDVAARLLDAILFVSTSDVATAFRTALESLDGWTRSQAQRSGRWMFVPFTGSAGESGDAMLHRFRHANNLAGDRYSDLFRYRAELMRLRPGPADTVVLVDDFSGTGSQACNAWEMFRELLPFRPRVFLVLVAASRAAQERVAAMTGMQPCAHIELGPDADIFSSECAHFSKEEKETLLHYGRQADPNHPRGWGDCGFVIVFSHTCPNNSIPLLHKRRPGHWQGLFPRYD